MKSLIALFIQAGLLFGYYPNNGIPAYISNYTNAGYNVSIAGTFVNIDDPTGVLTFTTESYGRGATAFINLMPDPYNPTCGNMDSILAGGCDQNLSWLANGIAYQNQKVFLAPFPEMNGEWTLPSYNPTLSPTKYKQTFIYIRNKILAVPANKNLVNFVFAPNGWSTAGNEFENYYPGTDYVDVIGFSAFNHIPCATPITFDGEIKPYINRMIAMDPTKPIFITQTGSSGTDAQKLAWMDDVVTKLAGYPSVRAILYFNHAKVEGNCGFTDWRIYNDDTLVPIAGWSGVAGKMTYWNTSSPNWSGTFPAPVRIFNDVNPINPLVGQDYIKAIYNGGITSGCGGGNYCPAQNVTRAQMAVFILKSKYGGSYNPPAASHFFTDMSGHWAEAWVDQLKREGITGGCTSTTFCPENNITRAELSIFLLREKYGASFSPSVVSITYSDTGSHWAKYWIERLKVDVVSYCSVNSFCPDSTITRRDMAYFIAVMFGL